MPTLRWPDAWAPFVHLATFALIVAILAHGQAVLVPLALAGFLAFVLVPPVSWLERLGVHRALAVTIAMSLALSAIGGFGYLVSRQLRELAANMPAYTDGIRAKVATLRATHGSLASFQKAVDEVSAELDLDADAGKGAPAAPPASVRGATGGAWVQPVVISQSQSDLQRLRGIVEPIFASIATAVIVLVLTAFLLVRREDVRNRVLRLSGQGRITVTTRTMDEAGRRISLYLLTQTAINVLFGAVVTGGLFLIGLPYAALWGACAGVLRFVPYIGALLAMLMPTALAFVHFEGWAPTLQTLGLFLAIDLLTAQVIEPLVVGHRTGVSALALLVMALLWTWLWGPIGLLLATPITVCLAVLGKHIPRLEFLAVLLGDAPPLAMGVSFYQRLLARDDDEASAIVEHELVTAPLERVLDDVVLPGLVWASAGHARDEIGGTELRFILDTTRSIVEESAEGRGNPSQDPDGELRAPRRVVGVPGRGVADDLVTDMVGTALRAPGRAFEKVGVGALVSELAARIADQPPDLVCVCALPPGGLSHARYLCKRLRAAAPAATILLVRPVAEIDDEDASVRLPEADAIVRTLEDLQARVEAMRGAAPADMALDPARAIEPAAHATPALRPV